MQAAVQEIPSALVGPQVNGSTGRPIKKAIFTLRINDYAPEICALTYPLIKAWAKKIGAEIVTITERKYPDWPVVYEKLQIYDLAREMGNEWNIYIDSDALVHPDMWDPTDFLTKDVVCHNGLDIAGNRFRYDQYFRRHGQHIGSCNWLAIASDLCLDLWHPLEDLTFQQARANIFPVVSEMNSGVITADHLIDDYVLSRNIARYGLKATSIMNIFKGLGLSGSYFWHVYTSPGSQKLQAIKEQLKAWKLV